MYNPVDGMIMSVNNGFTYARNLMLEVKTYTMSGRDSLLTQVFVEAPPTTVQKYLSEKRRLDKLREKEGVFLSLKLINTNKEVVDENLYWLPAADGSHSGLQQIPAATPAVTAVKVGSDIAVTISAPANGPVAFFNRLSIVDAQTKKRVLPVFYSDNYVSVLPGERRTVLISGALKDGALVEVEGWNVGQKFVEVR
ncbi:hypothetical protein MKQ70_10725 [Chitinophaga sedimenti]|uniref:hypothetical protein n=1 Tax=Chitinophaga sedimenti TaxID=2033606 RepID=UPI0020035BA3|nr:hypothetical protein [Chitinophaga sedimenti]MCK7555452.1 hypothetical protein [Chitinophaga sedimenti]